MHSGSLTVLHSLNISAHRVISAHLQLLIQNFEGKIVRIKFPILNPVAIFHLPAILHVSAELSSPQPIPDLHQDYTELSPYTAGISMQTQLWLKFIYIRWISSKYRLKYYAKMFLLSKGTKWFLTVFKWQKPWRASFMSLMTSAAK